NANDATLLTRTISALTATQLSTLQSRGVNTPYAGFPSTQIVRQELYPYPQYTVAGGGGISPQPAPLGQTWYDSLQVNVTKRYSHGLTLNANYTYAKNLDLMSSLDIFNRSLGKDLSPNDLPNQFRLTTEYQLPNLRKSGIPVLSNRIMSAIVADW